jgi:hypothetical protein
LNEEIQLLSKELHGVAKKERKRQEGRINPGFKEVHAGEPQLMLQLNMPFAYDCVILIAGVHRINRPASVLVIVPD